jgi:hypothetical protein
MLITGKQISKKNLSHFHKFYPLLGIIGTSPVRRIRRFIHYVGFEILTAVF